MNIVGESFCRPGHAAIYPGHTGVFDIGVGLVREPSNSNDPNAVAVYLLQSDYVFRHRLGYVPRRVAASIASRIDAAGGTVVCAATIGRRDRMTPWKVQLLVDFKHLPKG